MKHGCLCLSGNLSACKVGEGHSTTQWKEVELGKGGVKNRIAITARTQCTSQKEKDANKCSDGSCARSYQCWGSNVKSWPQMVRCLPEHVGYIHGRISFTQCVYIMAFFKIMFGSGVNYIFLRFALYLWHSITTDFY